MSEFEFAEPSAPPLESLGRKSSTSSDSGASSISFDNNLWSTVELTLSATNLINRDALSRSDPVCIVYIQDRSTDYLWVEVDRTECVKNDLNPNWAKKLTLQYHFEERQLLRFLIVDVDGGRNSDYLGKLECSLGEIVAAPSGKIRRPLQLPFIYAQRHKTCPSFLTVVAEELGDCRKVLSLKVKCHTSIRSSIFGKAKPCLSIHKLLDDGTAVLLYRTDKFHREICLRVASLTSGGNLERPLKISLFHKKQNSKWSQAKLIGEALTNYLQLVEDYRSHKGPILLTLPEGKSRRPSIGGGLDPKPSFIEIQSLNIDDQPTFIDHIKKGLKLSISFAIDFTASNGDPARHTSLHYKTTSRDNPYVLAIKTVGEIISDYSTDQKFAAFGFGAKGYPIANRVSHKFPINLKHSNPMCNGIDGVLTAYHRILKRIKLFGPTCFAPVIQEQIKIARQSPLGEIYYVLLILTDGIICDPIATTDAIVQAAELPISIVIVGIGDEDWKEMEKLDCDGSFLKNSKGVYAKRDIVQFVELKKFINFHSVNPIRETTALSRAVLAELPFQVCEWMSLFVK